MSEAGDRASNQDVRPEVAVVGHSTRFQKYKKAYSGTLRGRLVCLAILLPSAWLALLFWRVHAPDPLTAPALLVDRALQIASILCLLMVPVVLLATGRASYWAANFQAAFAVALGASTASAVLRAPFRWSIVLLGFATMLAGTALLVWLNRHAHLSLNEKLLAGGLALALPATQFWNATSFLPDHLTTSMSVVTRFVVQKEEAGRLEGVVEIELRNRGGSPARVVGSRLRLCFTKRDRESFEKLKCQRSHSVLNNLTQIDSGSAWHYHLAFSTTTKRSFGRIEIKIGVVRADRVRLESSNRKTSGKSCTGEVSVFDILPEARYRGVAQPPRFLVYDFHGTGPYHVAFTSDKPGCTGDSHLGSYFGMNVLTVNHEDWLTSPKSTQDQRK